MDNLHNAHIAIIGGGPAGLMAAEVLASAGCEVHVFDAMPSVGRKFLLAGRGGLNLTHSEAYEAFITRYRMPRAHIERWLAEFDAPALRAWAHRLGIETFVGSSGRIFPLGMKTSPLLRAWPSCRCAFICAIAGRVGTIPDNSNSPRLQAVHRLHPAQQFWRSVVAVGLA